MKRIVFAIAIVAASFAANAQDGKTSFGGGLRLGLPVGDFGDAYGFGIGAELQGEHHFSSNVSGTLTTGYMHFSGKDYEIPGIGKVEGSSFGYVPVLAGIRVYPSTSFFIGGKAGLSFYTSAGGGSAFTYEPQVGYNAQKFQLALGYQAQSDEGTTGHLGLTAIFKFN